MRILCSVLLAFVLSGCDATMLYVRGAPLSGRDLSIFETYAGRYCEVTDASGRRSVQVECSRLRDFVSPSDKWCTSAPDGFTPAYGHFPGQKKPMRLCRDLSSSLRSGRERIRFLVFGDAGRGEDVSQGFRQASVARAMSVICAPGGGARDDNDESDRGLGCDFAIMLGDLIYPHGVTSVWDAKLDRFFEDMYRPFGQFDFYAVPGNHDALGSSIAQFEYTWFSDRWRMLAPWFEIPDLPPWLGLFGLDTSAMEEDEGLTGSPLPDTTRLQLADAERDLCSRKNWRIMFGHHPNLSNGSHGGTPGVARRLTDFSENCPIDLYFAGHDHHQEHIHGQPFDTIIQGAGGAKIRPVKLSTLESPELGAQRFAAAEHGFALVDATEASLEVTFYGLPVDDSGPPRFLYRCAIQSAHALLALRGEPFAGCVPVQK